MKFKSIILKIKHPLKLLKKIIAISRKNIKLCGIYYLFKKRNSNNAILFLSHEDTFTGAPILFLSLANWWKDNFNDEIIFLFRRSCKQMIYDISHDFITLNYKSVNKILLLKLLRKYNVKAIISNTITNGHIQKFLTVLGVPQVCYVHELEYSTKVCSENGLKMVKSSTDIFIAGSEAVKIFLESSLKINSRKIRLVHDFYNIEKNRQNPIDLKKRNRIPKGALLVGCMGFWEWRKGKDLILHLALEVKNISRRNIHLIWFGNIPEHDKFCLEYDMKKANIDNMHFMPFQKNPEKAIAGLDIFAMISREDPFPIVNLIAVKYKVPIISFSDNGGTGELIRDNGGILIPYLDIHKFAEGIVELAEDPVLRKSLAEKCYEKVNSYSVESAGSKIKDILYGLIKKE